MNTQAHQLKQSIKNIISEMARTPEKYTTTDRNCFCRRRKIDFSTLMEFLLSFGSGSLGNEIGSFFDYQEGFPTTSAFIQQRKKLDYKALEYLFHEFNRQNDQEALLFKNYRLLAIDGSDLTLPYNPNENNVIGNTHVSTLHLNAIFDVCNKKFLDAIVQKGPKKNECAAACDLVDRITEKYPVIVMADRGYENYNLFAHIEERLFDYVIRVKDLNSTGMLSGMDLPECPEFDITKQVVITRQSTGPASINPQKYKYFSKGSRFDYIETSRSPDYEMTIRFVRLRMDDGNYEVLATSLPQDLFSADDLKRVYMLRWGIETGFREIKYILGLTAFHSKQENSILQEIYARLVMYNFSMSIIVKISPKEKDRRYQLQVNFTQATRICLHFFRDRKKEPAYDVETTILRFVLPVRPNRRRQHVAVGTCIVSFNYSLA